MARKIEKLRHRYTVSQNKMSKERYKTDRKTERQAGSPAGMSIHTQGVHHRLNVSQMGTEEVFEGRDKNGDRLREREIKY